MPFMEYIPNGWNCFAAIKNLFSIMIMVLMPLQKKSDYDMLPFAPYICSEFFFTEKFDTEKTILVLINDAWFSAQYFKDLMVLYARYKAVELQRDIIYVGHIACYWIAKDGKCRDVMRV